MRSLLLSLLLIFVICSTSFAEKGRIVRVYCQGADQEYVTSVMLDNGPDSTWYVIPRTHANYDALVATFLESLKNNYWVEIYHEGVMASFGNRPIITTAGIESK